MGVRKEAKLSELQYTPFLGVSFCVSSLSDVIAAIQEMAGSTAHSYVVTPNVDHMVMLDSKLDEPKKEAFRSAYHSAGIRLCDSRIIAGLARLKGTYLPVIAGSDLTAKLMNEHFGSQTKIAIIGGSQMTLVKVKSSFPKPKFVQYVPPMGVLNQPLEMARIMDFVAAEKPDYVLFAIGSPQSEIVAELCARDGRFGGVSLCIGASIEFLTGEKTRAPVWLQNLSLEWAHRLLTEPTRLWRRYLIDGPKIFAIFLRGGIRL
jgi:N-acetylglucosaminyldiphosphoundecaprenol N-acetyl-beta-D-mannosaminyltransferase